MDDNISVQFVFDGIGVSEKDSFSNEYLGGVGKIIQYWVRVDGKYNLDFQQENYEVDG